MLHGERQEVRVAELDEGHDGIPVATLLRVLGATYAAPRAVRRSVLRTRALDLGPLKMCPENAGGWK